jgi:hypothetical protein
MDRFQMQQMKFMFQFSPPQKHITPKLVTHNNMWLIRGGIFDLKLYIHQKRNSTVPEEFGGSFVMPSFVLVMECSAITASTAVNSGSVMVGTVALLKFSIKTLFLTKCKVFWSENNVHFFNHYFHYLYTRRKIQKMTGQSVRKIKKNIEKIKN